MLGFEALLFLTNEYFFPKVFSKVTNQNQKLRFVTFSIATNSFPKYNDLIRVDTD